MENLPPIFISALVSWRSAHKPTDDAIGKFMKGIIKCDALKYMISWPFREKVVTLALIQFSLY